MKNLILNKIDEKLIALSRIKDNMDEFAKEDKSFYEGDIKSSINEIKMLLDEFYALPKLEEPIKEMPIAEIGYTKEGYVRIKIPFIFRNSIVDFNKFSKALSKYLSVFLKKDIEFPFGNYSVFVKYTYEKSIDEKYFVNTFDLSLYWELFFVNLLGNYNVSVGDFYGDKNATEIYVVPSKRYKDFQKKYIFNETEDEKNDVKWWKKLEFWVVKINKSDTPQIGFFAKTFGGIYWNAKTLIVPDDFDVSFFKNRRRE